jgi:hypothetical protein
MKPLALLLFSAVVAAVSGCRASGPASVHERLDPDAAPLRAAFNADTGKVRILMLVSPT